MYDLQTKIQHSGSHSGEDNTNIKKIINDLEAHINTVIITERAVRKAMGKNLADDISKLQSAY
jgi:hypothetical protein